MAKRNTDPGPKPTPAQEKVLRLLVHGNGRVHYGTSGHWFVDGHDETFSLQNPVAMATLTRMEGLGWLAVVPQPKSEWSFQSPRKLTAQGSRALGRCPAVQSRKIDLPEHMLSPAAG